MSPTVLDNAHGDLTPEERTTIMAEQPPDYRTKHLSKKLDDIDTEIARLAMICKVRILDPGVIERVLKNDALVCGAPNQRAFDKLRGLLMMHYSVRDDALAVLGEAKTRALIEQIVASLRQKIGDGMGRPG
jgi:hypothetical protein